MRLVSSSKNRGKGTGGRSGGGKKGNTKKAGSGSSTRAKVAIIIALVFVIGFAAFVVSLGFYVDSLDTVFPNVWADGIKLSGMTLQEATRALVDEGYERNAEGISATVVFPDSSGFTITGEDAGLSLDAREAAIAAFEFGRDGSFFENELTYIRALFNRTDLFDLSNASYDVSIFREPAAEYTKAFNATLLDDNLQITDVSITFEKGTGIEPAVEDDVYALGIETLKRAIETNDHVTAQYIPKSNSGMDVDLQMIFDYIHVDPVSSRYDKETMSATRSSQGKSFDMALARAKIDSAAIGQTVVIPIFVIEPEITSEMINSMLFRDVLAVSKTNIAGTSNRLSNIDRSAKAIDGTILQPGDVFSFNGIVGRRTIERGYLEANAYIGGRVELEIGGGICQTSSTIYDAVLHTDIEVVERRAHGLTVAYLPYGNDATVDYGNIDFKFKNNTDFPMRIEVSVISREITVKIIGTKLDTNYIEIETVPISTTPFSIVTRDDDTLPQGHTEVYTGGFTGQVVDTYKLLYAADGTLISRTLVGRSSYRVQDRVILHGTMEPEEEPSTEPPDTLPTDPPPTDTPPPTDPPPTDTPPPTDPPPPPTDPVDPEDGRQEP